MPDPISYRLVGPGDAALLARIAREVFDHPLRADSTAEFLADPRHHLIVAMEDGVVVGMVSAFHYLHPDKRPELFINEFGVAATHRRRGIGRRLFAMMLDHGRALGCTEAWVGTEMDNHGARALYEAAGGGPGEPFALYTCRLAPKDSSGA